jgi:pilus assembly protein CpaB
MATTSTALGKKLNRPLVLVLLAALLAGGVTWVAYYYLQQREEAIKAEVAANARKNAVRKVQVVVPKVDVPAHTVLNGASFVARPVEEDLLYPDVILADDFPAMQGQLVARPVLKGRPVRLSDLMVPEVRDVSTILPAGRRAITIDVDNLNSIAKTLRPNHHVDIFLISKAPKLPTRAGGSAAAGATDQNEDAHEQAMLYMQDMVVLATGKEFQDVSQADGGAASQMMRPGEVEGKDKDFDSVTLLVTPAEAARLMVGQKMGTFRVVLRGAKDRAPVAPTTLRSDDLLPKSARGRDAGIEFIVGGSGDKMLSELAVLPSQAAAGTRPAPAAPLATPAAAAAIYDRRNKVYVMPASAANQPVPALRADK